MKLVPGRLYTVEEMRELVDQSTADQLQLQGYVLRHDLLTGKYSVVHWTQASSGREWGTFSKEKVYPGFLPRAPKIVKRTPQQRLDSLMLRFIDDCKRAGTVPGLSDAKVSEIVGEAWKTGKSEITADVVRQVAAHFLKDAENKYEASERKKVVRTAPSD